MGCCPIRTVFHSAPHSGSQARVAVPRAAPQSRLWPRVAGHRCRCLSGGPGIASAAPPPLEGQAVRPSSPPLAQHSPPRLRWQSEFRNIGSGNQWASMGTRCRQLCQPRCQFLPPPAPPVEFPRRRRPRWPKICGDLWGSVGAVGLHGSAAAPNSLEGSHLQVDHLELAEGALPSAATRLLRWHCADAAGRSWNPSFALNTSRSVGSFFFMC